VNLFFFFDKRTIQVCFMLFLSGPIVPVSRMGLVDAQKGRKEGLLLRQNKVEYSSNGVREKEKKEEENKQPSLALSPSFYTKSFLPKVPAFLPASFHPSVALLLAFLCLIKSRILYHNS